MKVDKNTCITAGVCWSIAPDIFEYDPASGKTRIRDPYRKVDTGSESIGQIPEVLKDVAKSAAEVCPTSSITVE
ncbi:MAG: ferredoxin [Nitrososphaerota archaeon]|nr:ferredoxin [Nitrososphaerota archaeon]